MADAYEGVSRGTLKLKGVTDGGVKKKKKKNKAKKALEDISQSTSKGKIDRSEEDHEEETVDTRTPAEMAYDKIKEKRAAERILKKAEKTHKQRVEKFNDYLDGLSEHYDIPKVSWTK
ncbi:protein FAM32A-like [Pocillopora verrucosa]|uniref:protein FAM32A-like n=1 Tax=Pocillopora verrucosa TaxID=203993 RepID=UPI0027977341|nr:protein FAM32A-like [Pocillopora verrucosa]